MEDVTIEVIDNNGDVVEVKPVNLVKGETVATFTFTKALTEDPEGVWTIAGVKVDLDLAANLKAVYEAADQVKLLEGLNKLGLTDVKGENIAFYEAELAKITDSSKDTYVELEKFTKEVAQKVVTDGNAEALKAVDEEAIVKAVNEAKTQVALLEALAPFERVNADWIADYEGVLGTAETSIKGIQTKIDGANALRVNPKVTALDLDNQAAGASIVKKDLNEAKVLVTNYQKPDGEGETTKAEILRKIDRQLAIVAVLEAETPAQLTVAMNNLKAVDAAYELNMDNYKDANRQDYIDAFKAETTATNKNTITKINTILVNVNAAQAVAPIQAIITAGNFAVADAADNQAALLKALKAYSDIKYVTDANALEYAELADTSDTTANAFGKLDPATATKAEVQALVDEANLAAINGAADADKTYAALVAYGNDIKDLSISNKAEYHTVFGTVAAADVQTTVDSANIAALQAQTTADGVLAKLQIMTQVKNVKAENAAAYLESVKTQSGTPSGLGGTLADIDAVQTAIDNINAAQAEVAYVKALNDATTAEAVRDALTNIALETTTVLTDYTNLTSADRLLVAEIFMDDDVFSAGGNTLVTTARTKAFGKYDTPANVKTDLDKVVAAVNGLVTAINTEFGTPTNASVQAVLADLVKANYTAYDELTAGEKLAVAEAFIAGYPVDKDGAFIANSYKSFSAYLEAVDAAIAAIK